MHRKKTKIWSGLLLLFGLMAFTTQPISNDTKHTVSTIPSICSIENQCFQGGEEIVYKLYYNWNFVWLSAGEVTFSVKDLGDQYHVSAVGRTYSSYEWFFKVRDVYESFLDKETLLPQTSIRDVHEGKYTLYDKVQFDQQKGKATSYRGKTKAEAEQKEYEVDRCMHDILSIIYFSRNLDFNQMSVGTEVPIKIFMDKEVWPLKFIYRGNEANKKIRNRGRFNTIKFTPQVILGDIFTEEVGMNLWVSDDKNKIPLLIESPLSVGSVKAVVKRYNGLRYELSSKIR